MSKVENQTQQEKLDAYEKGRQGEHDGGWFSEDSDENLEGLKAKIDADNSNDNDDSDDDDSEE